MRRADADPPGPLLVETDRGTWRARAVVNATGTWRKPFWPYYLAFWPYYLGRETFLGRQLHIHYHVSAQEFAGEHVIVLGGVISAVQHLVEISAVTVLRDDVATARSKRTAQGAEGSPSGGLREAPSFAV